MKRLFTYWTRAADLMLDFIVGLTLTVLFIALFAVGVPMILVAGIGAIMLIATASLTRLTGAAERHRAMAMHQELIEPAVRRRVDRTDGWRSLAIGWSDLTDPVTWKIIAHHLLTMLLGSGFIAVITAALSFTQWGIINARQGVTPTIAAIGIAAAGLICVIGYPILVGRLDAIASKALLGRGRSAQLQDRVDNLAVARQGAVDAASIERRRFERDLHDGVQPRLVSTAMTLDMARQRFDTDPQGAREMLDGAHEEIKASITELRQLARGMHPSVLSDRGLDAALSAIASRSTVPVSLSTSLPHRLSEEVEAVLYFVVAESLTNTAKHSGATSAAVTVYQSEVGVRAEITDNGRGEAVVTAGGGLAGIRDRVLSAGGYFTLTSQAGGPTTIVVEVPCES